MNTRMVESDAAPAAIGPYSQGIIAGGFLYTAGQIPLDPVTKQVVQGDIVAQTRRVLDNLQAVLAAAGASWKDVVKTTVYLQEMGDFPRMNEEYAATLATHGRRGPQSRWRRFHEACSSRSIWWRT